MKTLHECLAEYSVSLKNKPAIIVKREILTYGELYTAVCGFGEYLRSSGFRKGDFAVCRSSATLDYWVAYFGVQIAGGVFVPLEKDVAEPQMRNVIKSLDKIGALIGGKQDEQLSRETGSIFVPASEVIKLSDRPYGEFEMPELDDLGQILFTTGTTGAAKGVMLSNKYIASGTRSEIPYSRDTVMLLPTPTNHVLSVGRSTTLLICGATVVFTDGLADFGEFYYALSEYGVNATTLTPSALNYIMALTGEEFVKYDDKLVFIEIGGEKLPASRQQEFTELLPHVRFFNMYASTEASEICYYEFSRYGASDVRIGKPPAGNILHFTDENCADRVATKENPWFIAVESETHMLGYWKDEAATKKVLFGNKVLMSDYGYIDDEGFVCLAGRAGDVIISGGHKINPTDVESAAIATGLVADCVCFGSPDETFGKLVTLHVVMKEGVPFDFATLKNALAKHLEGFKNPQIIIQTDKVMRRPNGKIDRKYYSQIK